MRDEEIIAKMRARVEQCRRLARWINDPKAAAILHSMADEGDEDIRRIEAESSMQTDRR